MTLDSKEGYLMSQLREMAIEHKTAANIRKQSMVAAIIDGTSIVSIGKNSYVKTHPAMKKLAEECDMSEKQFLHAEIAAIAQAASRGTSVRGYDIYVSRHNGLISKPCEICQLAIQRAGIVRMVFVDENGKIAQQEV